MSSAEGEGRGRSVEAGLVRRLDEEAGDRGRGDRDLGGRGAVAAAHRAEARRAVDGEHLLSMGRQTAVPLGSGVVPNTPDNLSRWVADPATIKPGVRMPAMDLDREQLDEVVRYLETLR